MVLCSDGVWDAISTEEVAHPMVTQQPYGPDPDPNPNPNPNEVAHLVRSLTTGRWCAYPHAAARAVVSAAISAGGLRDDATYAA